MKTKLIKEGAKLLAKKGTKRTYKGRKRGRKAKTTTTVKAKAPRARKGLKTKSKVIDVETGSTVKRIEPFKSMGGEADIKKAQALANKAVKEDTPITEVRKKLINIVGADKASILLNRIRRKKTALRKEVEEATKNQPVLKLPAGRAKAPNPSSRTSKFDDKYQLTKTLKVKKPGEDTYDYITVPRATPKREVEKVDKFIKSLSAEDKKLVLQKTKGDFRKLKRISKVLTGDEAAGMARTSGVTKTGKTVKKIFPGPMTSTQVREAMGYLKDKLKSADIPQKTKDQKIEAIRKLLDQGYPFKTKGTKQSTKQTFDDIMKSFGTGKNTAGIVANTPVGRKTGGKVGAQSSNTRIRRTTPRGIGAARRGYGKAMKG